LAQDSNSVSGFFARCPALQQVPLPCFALVESLATFLLLPTEIISQRKHVHKGVLHKFLEDTFSTNALYYDEQPPMVEAAAKRFQLHWNFAQLRPFVDAHWSKRASS